MTEQRFSKVKMTTLLESLLDNYERLHRIDPNNGTAQVKCEPDDPKYIYGRYAALRDLLDAIR